MQERSHSFSWWRSSSPVKMNDLGIVQVTLEMSENAVVLPKRVIHSYSGRTYVNILVDGLKEERDVQTGIQTSTDIEIVKGIDEGDQVIAR